MNVAVIGGTRHIGPEIVRLLVEAGHRVSVYTRGRSAVQLPSVVDHIAVDRSVRGQLGQALHQRQPDVVIDMVAFQAHHVEEVITVLPKMRQYIFCSSTAIYGHIGDTTPDETTPVMPDSGYTHGKVACEQYVKDHHINTGLRFTILRLAHPYGPRDHLLYTTGRESLFLDRIRSQRTILVPGTGLRIRVKIN